MCFSTGRIELTTKITEWVTYFSVELEDVNGILEIVRLPYWRIQTIIRKWKTSNGATTDYFDNSVTKSVNQMN